jgi:hypothetical protein
MAKKRIRLFTDGSPKEFSQDRRSKRRYPIELPVHYKIVKNYLVMGTGTGSSIDLSSGGIAFTSDTPLRVGSYLELSISWPVLLNQTCALKLVASGRVVRSEQNRTAISLDRYEFRTSGAKTFQTASTEQSLPAVFR